MNFIFILLTVPHIDFPLLIGMVAAIVHVLTGPDHLAAVTPLVLETQEKHWRIGLLWGLGHIIGMLLIGVLYFFFRDYFPLEAFSKYSDQLVGVILIGLGLMAFYRIRHENSHHKHPHIHHQQENSVIHIHGHKHLPKGDKLTLKPHAAPHQHEHHETVAHTGTTALGIGVVHGFAGIAHFVLMLPVLGYERKIDSTMYFIGFAIGIIMAMVIYAAITGYFSKAHNKKQKHPGLLRNLRFWGGLAAILVGIFWLTG